MRCPVSQFTEKRTTDIGEGLPSAREVKSIGVPAGRETQLAPRGSYIMLLQLSEPLAAGRSFDCSVSFAHAGAQQVTVTVRPPP